MYTTSALPSRATCMTGAAEKGPSAESDGACFLVADPLLQDPHRIPLGAQHSQQNSGLLKWREGAKVT